MTFFTSWQMKHRQARRHPRRHPTIKWPKASRETLDHNVSLADFGHREIHRKFFLRFQ
jgi:hypothetical protein